MEDPRLTESDDAPPAGPAPAPGPKVPSWVVDVAKWGSLSRHERRQLQRHHAKQPRPR